MDPRGEVNDNLGAPKGTDQGRAVKKIVDDD
jgi:hypothetical protein